ncbi:eukaryotic translation initiation factor 4E transporter-like isoform X2 [Periplaneta americana]|uniref:eukaryotic translation initiation factor 4E transporter-like isoform X2 n=1 Tax=Periplaneta americana TaxID=6978 RepID=UPI0037E91873
MNRPGPLRYRYNRRRRNVATGNPIAEAQSSLVPGARIRWFRRQARRTKRVTFCDEELAMSISEGGEALDPGAEERQKTTPVLPHLQYTREELMEFQSHPLSKKRPKCLDPAFNNSRGVWDPERWHLDRKRSETPPEDERGGRGDLPLDHKRRTGDPRERLRKEQDGIVLSPQRRSFNSGCFVNMSQNNRRAESPLGKTDRDRDMSHRDMAPTRRIGSGRILTHNVWDFRIDREKDADQQGDYSFQRGAARDRDRDERFERRSFGRDFDRDRDKDRHRDRNRYTDRRRAYSDSREEEPEWFSGGPTSQHDTIELRGFEDIPEEQVARGGSKKQSPSQTKLGKSNVRAITVNRKSSDTVLQQQNNSGGPGGRSTPTPIGAVTAAPAAPHSPITEDGPMSKPGDASAEEEAAGDKPAISWEPENEEENGSHTLQNSEFNLDLDDILKIDALPLLSNGTANEGNAGSRFRQFFQRDSPVNQAESRRSSLQEELLNNIINDITEPNIMIPPLSESDTYFAPISPAANTATSSMSVSAVGSNTKPTLLLEMLQRGGQGDAALPPVIRAPSIRDLEVVGKMQSVEELEARMRQQGLNVVQQNNKNMAQSSIKKTEEDLVAFKKLLAQVSDGKVIPATATNGALPQKPQPLSLLQMLSKSQHDSSLSVGRPVTHQQQPPASTSAEQVGLNPISAFGLNSHHSPGSSVVTSQPQSQQTQMQIPQDLVMKLLQVQQQQRQQQQQQQQQEMLNKLLASNQQQQQSQQSQSASRLGHVPVPTQFQVPPPPSLSPLPPDLQLMVTNAQPSRELLQRPEAQAIIQGLKHGEITSQHLVQQLQNPAMQHRHREVLVSILKLQMQPGVSPRATSPHPHVQQPDLLHQMMLQQQQQQHQQQQLRIPSPLNSAYCQQPPVISPNLANNPNTLSVQHPVLPHRVPSPRELIVHTQNIMQSALIKKKLEEQRENFRKRQEMQQSLSPNMGGMSSNSSGGKISDSSSPAKHLSSPTPLAFTPTSVLRKMTAEKEAETSGGPVNAGRSDSKPSVSASNDHKPQSASVQTSRQSVTAPQLRTQQTAVPPWNMTKQHQGRPIVKGNTNFQFASNVDYQQQQQQHRHTSLMSGSGSVPRSKMTLATPPPNMPPQFNSLMMMHRQSNVRAQALQAHLATLQQAQHHTQQQQRNLSTPSLQQILLNQNFGNTGRGSGKSDSRIMRSQQSQAMGMGRQGQSINLPVNRDMSTSPTSNQLARWFSPELLAQARAGQLPDMPPILSTQNMLSLEELERLQQASAAVHN